MRFACRFTPQGAGHRLGKVTIAHTAAAEPFSLGLGGSGYAPVLSFTPAQITLVQATYGSGTGILNSAQNLAVDGGDILYVPDIGNGLIRRIDSSGTLNNFAPDFAVSASVAVDSFGIMYSANVPGSSYYFSDATPWGGQTAWATAYSPGSCTPSTPCPLSTVGLRAPANLSMDAYNNLFMEEGTQGAAEIPVGGIAGGAGSFNLWYLYDQFTYSSSGTSAFAVDASDNIYTAYNFTNENTCLITSEAVYGAEYGSPQNVRAAGSDVCGFSGDGGQAKEAEIGGAVGQIAFDIAGNMYFSDTVNQRVRRVDASTGIIHTIAGTGNTGSGIVGGGGAATGVNLNNPTGVGVDSQGQVYILSNLSGTTNTSQIVWKVGPRGIVGFNSIVRGTSTVAKTVIVSNTGNAVLNMSGAQITGANAADFAIDPVTTTCGLTSGSTLGAGQSCQIGIIFTPGGVGARVANLVMADNTVTFSNTVQLSGTGALPAASVTIASPASGASVPAGTAVPFKVLVTASPAPTGKVTMTLDGTAISGSPATLSGGVAQLSVTTSVTGSHTLSATYSGDSNFAASGPITVTYNVTASSMVPSKVKLKASLNPATVCKALSFTATVSSSKGGKPAGEVELMDGSKLLGTASLKSGVGKITLKTLAPGTSMLTAVYMGDKTHATATSTKLKEVVKGSSNSSSCAAKK